MVIYTRWSIKQWRNRTPECIPVFKVLQNMTSNISCKCCLLHKQPPSKLKTPNACYVWLFFVYVCVHRLVLKDCLLWFYKFMNCCTDLDWWLSHEPWVSRQNKSWICIYKLNSLCFAAHSLYSVLNHSYWVWTVPYSFLWTLFHVPFIIPLVFK